MTKTLHVESPDPPTSALLHNPVVMCLEGKHKKSGWSSNRSGLLQPKGWTTLLQMINVLLKNKNSKQECFFLGSYTHNWKSPQKKGVRGTSGWSSGEQGRMVESSSANGRQLLAE